jgi:hypothetical protein
LVGFVDVADHFIQEGAERRACTNLGRLDVALRRAALQTQQQQRRRQVGREQGITTLQRFLPKYSCLRTIRPSYFQAPILRAQPEFQRRKRLEVEDLYLRSLLIDEYLEEYMDQQQSTSMDDITIV